MQAAGGAALSAEPPADPRSERVPPTGGDDPSAADDPTAADQGPADVTAAPAGRRGPALLAAVAAAVLLLDVVTKVLVVAELEGRRTLELLGGQLLVRVSRNPGAAFSFAEDATLVFTLVAVVVVAAILRVAGRVRSRGWAVGLGLLLGGASGNLVDRLLRAPGPGRGAVVDFLDFQVWPSFNVADSAIVTGGLLAVLLSLRNVELDGTRRRRSADDA